MRSLSQAIHFDWSDPAKQIDLRSHRPATHRRITFSSDGSQYVANVSFPRPQQSFRFLALNSHKKRNIQISRWLFNLHTALHAFSRHWRIQRLQSLSFKFVQQYHDQHYTSFSIHFEINMSHSYDMDTKPSAQEAVKRLSSGFSLSESANHVMTPKDDKSLKIATFSLQGYLKVRKKKEASL